MNVVSKKSVEKDIEKVPTYIQLLAAEQIKKLKVVHSLSELENIQHLKGTDEPYYRMKFNDYRFLLYHDTQNDVVTIMALLHRKDAYKKHNLPWRK